jgi:outer membrane protein TolC
MNRITALIFAICFSLWATLSSQEQMKLTFDDVIYLAREQSPMGLMAQHTFNGDYWRYRTHRASFLPNLSLNATIPDLNRSLERLTRTEDGRDVFVERKLINSSVNLELNQNIGFTGGTIFMNSALQRIDNLGENAGTSYLSTPVSIGFRQPINGFNSYKWQRLIEPLRFEESKKNYLDAMEQVSLRAVNYFFELAVAQKNLEIAIQNYSNADTLFRIAQGRYQLGTIAENELLQMELTYLNAGANMNESQIDLEMRKYQLNSFLGFSQDTQIELIIPHEVPRLEIDPLKALNLALENNPDILAFERQLFEAERDVAVSKSEKGLNASLFASFGLTQRAGDIQNAYINPQDQERVRVGIQVPIADWGMGKGRYRMAQSAQEVVRTNVKQAEMDFRQQILLNVMQFNMQDDQLRIASKADTIAELRYEVTKQRFLIGKISVLDLNVAQTEKDVAARSYLSALRLYWSNFYNLRALTLYDWIRDESLQQEFDVLIH